MEAALRSVYEIYTGNVLENVNFENVRGLEGVRRATINLNGFELKVGIAHGLGNARRLLEDIRNGHNEYHAIEIMACPVAVSGVAANRSITDEQIYYMHVPEHCIRRMLRNLYGNLMRTRIFKSCMKSIWANRSAKRRICCCTLIISTNRSIKH